MTIRPFTAPEIPDSPLSHRNPTMKLALVLAVSLALVFVLDPLTTLAVHLLALIGLLGFSGLGVRRLARAHLPFLVLAISVLAVNVLTRPGEVLWQWGILRMTTEGLEIGAALSLRMLVIGTLSTGVVLTTDAVALMTSLHHNAKLPATATYAVLAGYRMLQEMPREWQTIQQAHDVRDPPEAGRRRRGRLRRFRRTAFTLLVVTVRKSERIARSLESRGLGLTPRTTWRPVRVTGWDWVMAAIVLGAVATVITISATLGVLTGAGALLRP